MLCSIEDTCNEDTLRDRKLRNTRTETHARLPISQFVFHTFLLDIEVSFLILSETVQDNAADDRGKLAVSVSKQYIGLSPQEEAVVIGLDSFEQ